MRVWPIEDLLFEIRHIDKLHKLYYKFKYTHVNTVLNFLQKHDVYNAYVIMENNMPFWLNGHNKHTGHRHL